MIKAIIFNIVNSIAIFTFILKFDMICMINKDIKGFIINMKNITSVTSAIKPKPKLNRIQICILYFFLFACIGWLMETLYAIYNLGHFTKRGFLYGPICPIYGYGALMLILFLGKYRKNNLKLFVYAAVLFSAFEYIVSYALDALFSMHWWDYTNEFFNIFIFIKIII